MEKSWNNQYINLIKSKPGYILCSDSDQLNAESASELKKRMQDYKNIYCEIGSGSGEHLLLQAGKFPAHLYIGLELRFKRVFRTAEKAEVNGLKNIIVARHNAKKIEEIFPPQSLNGVFINFPDPWTGKRRWEKHRLLTDEYIKTLVKLLVPSGFISYKTDHRERFLQICDILQNSPDMKVKKLTENLVTSEFYSGNAESEFERLFTNKGLPIHYILTVKN